jgi:hypothetical protein
MKTKHKLTQDFQFLSDDKKNICTEKRNNFRRIFYKFKDISLKNRQRYYW